ncbi:MAG TPA: nucleotide pyrophosphohydrolase [Candidatus Saccharimonadales bacterium]|nr:nucleotide pyrophosphohydrolase [Candidatus Saccharimonadales bacterium]
MNDDLRALQQKIVAFRDARDWKQFHNPKDVAISLALEAGELLEHFQWKNSAEITKHLQEKRDDVSDELADVLYWVLLMANDLGIDLSDAVNHKLNKNELKYPIMKAKGNHKKYTEL